MNITGMTDVAKTGPVEFMRQVKAEADKIAWPTRQETLLTGFMVAVLATVLGLFFLGVDTAFEMIVNWLLSLVR